MNDAALMEIRSRAEFAEAPHPVTSYWFAYHDRRELVRLYDALAAENAKLREEVNRLERERSGDLDRMERAVECIEKLNAELNGRAAVQPSGERT